MDITTIILAILAVAIPSYLVGSICFSIVVSRGRHQDDVRAHGSGNAGMTNVLRTYGRFSAALTLLGDGGKGALMAWVGTVVFSKMLPALSPLMGGYLAMLMVVIGHAKPIYFSFKGGKGIIAMAMAILVLDPLLLLVGLVIFLSVFFATRMISAASLTISAALPVLTLVLGVLRNREIVFSTIVTLIVGGMLIWLHRGNIQRIKAGTEYKFERKRRRQ